MERYTTARRGTAWPIFLPGGWATIGRAIAVAATLLGTTPVVSARGVQQQGEAREPVEPNSPSEFMAILPSGESVQVYPCARNRATDAITKHCYLYLPPLTLERDSDGRVLASETPSGGVSIRMIGNSQHLTNGVHAWLADEDMLPDARRPGSAFVGPFPYHQIRVLDADHGPDVRWHAVALSTDEGSVAQEWITFVFTPLAGVSESPAEFIERLNDPDRLPSLRAVLSYGGRTVVVNSLSLTASMLRGTNFLVDLKGDGGRDLVTRNQARDLLLTYATYVTQITYTESPDQVTVNPGWLFDSLFKVVVISAEDFWADAQYLLRVGFSDKDLLPDTHRQMLVQTAWELLNEEDTHFSKAVSEYWRRGESKTEGSYEGSMPLVGSAKASFSRTAPRDDGGEAERLEKAEFLKSLESEDSLFEWDGEVIVPKDVVLYQLDEAQLDSETELASISVTTVRSTASLGYTIYNSPWMVSDVASLDFARLLWVADQGNVSAQTELGSRYENGRGGVRQDDSDAAYWSRRAAGEGEGNARAMTNLGVMYRQGRGVQKDDAEAARWFLPAAEHGNAIAQTNLAIMYMHGLGVEQDDAEAVHWSRRAAEQGNARAMTDLGLLYAEGRGVRQDESEAVHWVRQAAEQGDARALAVLGVMYEHGLGVRQDDAEAVGLLLLAAEQGDADAQTNLGLRYADGRGVRQDYAEAARWLLPAAEQGEDLAQRRLGYLYLKGLGVRQDDAEAARWYRRAAEQGNATGQYSLGLMYETGRGVRQDDAEAAYWYRLAAEQGVADAQNKLGTLYGEGRGVRRDAAEAVRWFRLAAEQGNAQAQYNLGIMYEFGRSGRRDAAEAVRWYRAAAEQGHATAQYSLGNMHLTGKGVRRDDAEAVRWYRLAAEQGVASAQHNLGIMYETGRGGVRQSYAEAVRWYRQAAEHGHANAQYILGNMHEIGKGARRDRVESTRWYRLAAKQGHEDAQKALDSLR